MELSNQAVLFPDLPSVLPSDFDAEISYALLRLERQVQ